MFWAAKPILTAIVAGEKNDRVILQFQLAQQAEHLADVVVHHAHHGSVVFYVLRDGRIVDPRLALVQLPRGIVRGDVVHTVRRRDREVTEKRVVLVFADKLQTRLHDRVMRVRLARSSADVALQFHLLAVANEVRRIKRVCVYLIVVAVKNIEAVLLRHTGRIAPTTTPLAEAAGRVADFLEDRGDGRLARAQRSAAVVRANRGVPGVLAGH